MCEDNLEDGLILPQEPDADDADTTRLMLQHCVMPAYQFIIQVAPDQTTVTTQSWLLLLYFMLFCQLHSSVFVTSASKLLAQHRRDKITSQNWCTQAEDLNDQKLLTHLIFINGKSQEHLL